MTPAISDRPWQRPSPFHGWSCPHPLFDEALQWLLKRILGLSEPAILLVVGPTGAGKSTLIRKLILELAAIMREQMLRDPSLLHKVYAEAVYLPGRGFDWQGLFEALLADGGEVLIDRKVDTEIWPPTKPSLRNLERATNRMLRMRRPPVCIIDEGGSFLESSNDEALVKVIDYLKSLGNRCQTHFAIFGDYRLARLMRFSGQLNRRCLLVHLSNYPLGFESNFTKIVTLFEARLREKGVATELSDATEFLFKETCGCVGLLKQALELAWLEAEGTSAVLNKDLLIAERLPISAVEKWRGEIDAGHIVVREFFEGRSKSSS